MANTPGFPLDVERVRKRLDRLGLTHAELAERMGITRSAATRIVGGRQNLSAYRARRLAAALGYDPEGWRRLIHPDARSQTVDRLQDRG